MAGTKAVADAARARMTTLESCDDGSDELKLTG